MYSFMAERNLVGYALSPFTMTSARESIFTNLDPDDFYVPALKLIYTAARTLYRQGRDLQEINKWTVLGWIEARWGEEWARLWEIRKQGVTYISNLSPSRGLDWYYCFQIVQEAANFRRRQEEVDDCKEQLAKRLDEVTRCGRLIAAIFGNLDRQTASALLKCARMAEKKTASPE